MAWLILVLISAVLASFSQIYAKKALLKEHAVEFLTVLTMFSALFSLIFYPNASFDLPAKFYVIIFGLSSLSAIAGILFIKSLRHMEISTVSPLTNLSPLFLLVISFIFLGEKLTWLQLGGIFLLVSGTYFLESKHFSKKVFEPFKELFRSKFTIFTLLALVLYSICAATDKYIISNGVNAYTLLILGQTFLFIIYAFITFTFYKGFKDVKHGITTSGVTIGFCAFIGVLSTYFYYEAISLAFVSLVIPIKRLSTLMSTVVGGGLFHEHDLGHKIIGCIIMVIGAVFIAI